MPDKLSQSLDQIMSDRRKSTRSRRARPGAKATTAPAGGVTKKTKPAEKKPVKAVPTGPSNKESKVQVSNLPRDVTEVQIKEYFTTTVGAIKKVLLSYGPNGESRGVATIIFAKSDGAAKAAKELNGLKVDGRPMKIEVILGAEEAPAAPAPKPLSDRIQKPAEKAKPKPATATPKAATSDKAGKPGRRRARAAKGKAGAGRPKPKTAEELDAEMADYWGGGANAESDAAMANGGAVQPAANGDTGMEEDVVA
ncbi:uncharacterized protein PV09_02341 [Verruconis gallopava]|uniref:RRM domain-containing protein n=1 Tax=Verruconis gallopava TaxID=253628 RepID=A0A0D2B5X1_9PEZI|nr:uncharacterized protein PV09_02341 [Verruconis gallopava]KIW06629.1 hypothetical protein PV09_02341 [Verruconis gallopava]